MQINPNSDRKTPYSTVNHPMQMSMMQLNSRSPQPISKSPLSFQELPQYQTMKKSFVTSDNPSLDDSPTSLKHNYSFFTKAMGYQPINREQRISHEAGTTSASLREKLSPTNVPEAKYESNPEDFFKTSIKSGENSGIESRKDQLLKEIFKELKENYFPSLIKILKKEVMEEVFNLKTQVQILKQQTKKALKKQQNSLLQYSLLQNNSKISSLNQNSSKSDYSTDLQTHFFLLQGKLAQIESQFANQLKHHQQKLDFLQSKLTSQNEVKFGTLKSSLPPLLLQYKQIMTLKQQKKSHEFLLSHSTYYIDRQGYLLDHENYYLLDVKGAQIKLQEKHLKLLSLQNIFQE